MVFTVLHYMIRMNVSINSYNCNHISHVISLHILLKCCKEKEPKDEQFCITVHIIGSICDADPLDNLSNKAYLSEHCFT